MYITIIETYVGTGDGILTEIGVQNKQPAIKQILLMVSCLNFFNLKTIRKKCHWFE